MSFSSKMYPGEIIVDHSTHSDITHQGEYGRGYEAPTGFGSVASEFPQALMIPENDVPAMIQEIEERGMRQSERMINAQIPPKDQQQTNYCWGNAPAHAMEWHRMLQGQSYKALSAASVCAPINSFRNQGGSGTDALEYMSEFGINTEEEWPANAIDRRLYTAENKQKAMKNRATQWIRITTKAQLTSYLLRLQGITSVGYPWWSHEVSCVEPIMLDGVVAYRDRNNWGKQFGYNGFFIVRGSRMNFDECIAPLLVTPNES